MHWLPGHFFGLFSESRSGPPVSRPEGIEAIRYTSLALRQEDSVATITLDRPDNSNMVDEDMAAELRQATIPKYVSAVEKLGLHSVQHGQGL